MKTSFRKIFYWSLGSHAGLLLILGISTLIVSCSRRDKVIPHVFTLHAAPPAEKPAVKVSEPKPKPPVTQQKKTPPPVVKKTTPPPKKEEKKTEPKPTPSKSYADFLKDNPLPETEKQPIQPVTTPPKPTEDPLKDIRSELQSMIKDTQDTNMSSSQLKALQSYIGQLRSQLNVLWEQPQALPPGEWVAHVEFTVSGNGKISGVRFVKRSENPVFDDSIVRAMNQFQSAPPPPDRKTHTFEVPFRIVLR